MKKLFLLSLLLLAIQGFAQERFRLYGLIDLPLMENPSYNTVTHQLQYGDNNLYGFGFEGVFGTFGWGMEMSMVFDVQQDITNQEDWWMDLNWNTFINYHFFEQDWLLDPYVGIGFGQICLIDIEENPDENHKGEDDIVMASLYPFYNLGLNIILDDVFIGGKVRYHHSSYLIPDENYPRYPMADFSFGLSAGFSF